MKTIICIRCKEGILKIQKESNNDVEFFTCNSCGWHFARSPGEELHDRWLSPLSLILYSQIFESDPRTSGEKNARYLAEEMPDKISLFIEEIERELNHPTQKVSQLHEFVYPEEDGLREHLKDVLKVLNSLA